MTSATVSHVVHEARDECIVHRACDIIHGTEHVLSESLPNPGGMTRTVYRVSKPELVMEQVRLFGLGSLLQIYSLLLPVSRFDTRHGTTPDGDHNKSSTPTSEPRTPKAGGGRILRRTFRIGTATSS